MSSNRSPMTSDYKPFLSVIIPAYNEEPRIVDTLEQIVDYLKSQSYTWEVAVVDDGSTDSTASLVNSFAQGWPHVRLVSIPHGGKGWAVNHGMLSTMGEYRFLCDADLSMPVEQLSRFFPPEISNFDIAIGSREASGSNRIGEPYRRHVMGRVYNVLVRLLAVPGLLDTQCGFKCFRGQEATDLFSLQRLRGFAFDVEILFLAVRRGLRVREVPIDWYFRPQSKVRALLDSLGMSWDIVRVRWNNLRGKYRSLASPANEDMV